MKFEKKKPIDLNFTVEEKIYAIFNWSENTDTNFDTAFVSSLDNQIRAGRNLSAKQEGALDKIVTKFSIDVEEWA